MFACVCLYGRHLVCVDVSCVCMSVTHTHTLLSAVLLNTLGLVAGSGSRFCFGFAARTVVV